MKGKSPFNTLDRSIKLCLIWGRACDLERGCANESSLLVTKNCSTTLEFGREGCTNIELETPALEELTTKPPKSYQPQRTGSKPVAIIPGRCIQRKP
ncbi:unnamed protein product [Cuscuta campestris]|uniref:Uncharacterized protein n=1 Tax=Cuscuta campestris TaxID=132261 RepID=A0A484KLJ2_9ASTE|nr:unnamed protein product [Cuscuta campestris]